MDDVVTQVDWLGAAIASVAFIALGGVCFGALVPRQYLRVMGRDSAPATTAVSAVGPLVCTVVVVPTSAVLIAGLDLRTLADAVVFGLVVGVGHLTAMTFQIAINPTFPHPIRYGPLNAPFFVVGSVVTSTILVLV